MSEIDKIGQIFIMIGSELKDIGSLSYNDGSINSCMLLAKLDAYSIIMYGIYKRSNGENI